MDLLQMYKLLEIWGRQQEPEYTNKMNASTSLMDSYGISQGMNHHRFGRCSWSYVVCEGIGCARQQSKEARNG